MEHTKMLLKYRICSGSVCITKQIISELSLKKGQPKTYRKSMCFSVCVRWSIKDPTFFYFHKIENVNSAANNFQFQQHKVGNFVFSALNRQTFLWTLNRNLNIKLPFVGPARQLVNFRIIFIPQMACRINFLSQIPGFLRPPSTEECVGRSPP